MITEKIIIDELKTNGYSFIGYVNDKKEVIKVCRIEDESIILIAKYISCISVGIYESLKEQAIDGIPRINDILGFEDHALIIEEYVDGKNVGEMIEAESNYLTHVDSIYHIISGVLDVLSKLGEMNPPVIHRDIKPDNIMIDRDRKVYLVDFNISRELDGTKVRDTVAMGTRGFAAPEQYGFSESDIRTDFYSLGATVKYMIDNVELDRNYQPDNKRLKTLQLFASKCMMMDKRDRFQTVEEIRDFLKSSKKTDEAGRDNSFGYHFDKKVNSRALPGFRSGNPVNMIIATFIYLLIGVISVCIGLVDYEGYENLSSSIVNVIRVVEIILSYLVFLTAAFFLMNYRGVRERAFLVKKMKSDRSKMFAAILEALVIFLGLFFCEGLIIVTIVRVLE